MKPGDEIQLLKPLCSGWMGRGIVRYIDGDFVCFDEADIPVIDGVRWGTKCYVLVDEAKLCTSTERPEANEILYSDPPGGTMGIASETKSIRSSELIPKKNDTCERCGFVPEETYQLDVVDIVGCSESNDASNYITLCVNCQRLLEAMRDGCLSPAEIADLKDVWRRGELFN